MNRIELIASLTKGSQCVCDIGCDHAYVLIECINKYEVVRGIAADIAAGPLSAAGDNISLMHLEDRIEIIQSDGFKKIDKDFDTAVLAGMGGYLIRDILDASLDKIKEKKLILEANTDRPMLREYLVEHGFAITDEHAIYDMGKYYEVMVAVPGSMNLSPLEKEFGPVLLRKREPDFLKKMEEKRNMLLSILPEIKNPDTRSMKENELKKLERILDGNE